MSAADSHSSGIAALEGSGELLLRVLALLDVGDLVAASGVSVAWHVSASAPVLWQSHVCRRWHTHSHVRGRRPRRNPQRTRTTSSGASSQGSAGETVAGIPELGERAALPRPILPVMCAPREMFMHLARTVTMPGPGALAHLHGQPISRSSLGLSVATVVAPVVRALPSHRVAVHACVWVHAHESEDCRLPMHTSSPFPTAETHTACACCGPMPSPAFHFPPSGEGADPEHAAYLSAARTHVETARRRTAALLATAGGGAPTHLPLRIRVPSVIRAQECACEQPSTPVGAALEWPPRLMRPPRDAAHCSVRLTLDVPAQNASACPIVCFPLRVTIQNTGASRRLLHELRSADGGPPLDVVSVVPAIITLMWDNDAAVTPALAWKQVPTAADTSDGPGTIALGEAAPLASLASVNSVALQHTDAAVPVRISLPPNACITLRLYFPVPFDDVLHEPQALERVAAVHVPLCSSIHEPDILSVAVAHARPDLQARVDERYALLAGGRYVNLRGEEALAVRGV